MLTITEHITLDSKNYRPIQRVMDGQTVTQPDNRILFFLCLSCRGAKIFLQLLPYCELKVEKK